MTGAAAHHTVRDLIRVTQEYFAGKGLESARLNAERLLADVLGLSRMELYLQADRPVLGEELDRYRELVKRRGQGEPLQTILGMTEFYSRPFKVEPGVFIPRPETEHLVEAAVEMLTPGSSSLLAPVAVEVGCGTGIIGISLACELPRLVVHATEINPRALDLARRNALALEVTARVHFHAGSRFDPLPDNLRGQVDLLVSNPPYVRRGDIPGLSVEVAEHDPHEALDGGEDGLVFYRALAAGLGRWLRPGGGVALEIGHDQSADVEGILGAVGIRDLRTIKDYSGRDRVVLGRMAP
ncbi:protein-(glutamine-N5) methyltransferase, release factor-specific [bacterium DOLZORAL124_64_63]|nr:MAG: protein-(glutamine-N5) methyltransferase, release factor-specific [bacterium DOLZORAL124_64_63]